MQKREIKKIYLNKINQLKSHNFQYYEKNEPKISDSDYDKLKNKIFILEKKYKFLNSKDSPSNSVGFNPSKNFLKARHRERMYSLSNAFDKNDLENFELNTFYR